VEQVHYFWLKRMTPQACGIVSSRLAGVLFSFMASFLLFYRGEASQNTLAQVLVQCNRRLRNKRLRHGLPAQ
jgi:hypothetical protein